MLVNTRHEYDRVFAIYVPIAIVVFAAIVLVMGFAVLRYRRRPWSRRPAGTRTTGLKARTRRSWPSSSRSCCTSHSPPSTRLNTVSARERPSLTIDVTAAKWEWQFALPTYGFSVRSGTVGRQQLVVPTGEAIRFELVSADVIHSFWIPALRYKRDLIPGAAESVTLMFPARGVFAGQCAEFCGLRHADMVFTVHAVSPVQFDAWARSRGRASV